LETVKKIAVVRANALGDFIFVLPALRALKETFPGVEIVYLGKTWHQEFLKGRPGLVDRVVVVPPYPGVGAAYDYQRDEAELDQFFAEMQGEEFDFAFQFHGGGGNSNPFTKRLGAKKSIGLQAAGAPPLDINVPYIMYFSEPMRYLEVVSKAGAKTAFVEPEFESIPSDLDELKTIIPDYQGKKLVVIHPGATDLRRRWSPENFATIADFLIKTGYTIIVTGSEWEREVTDAVIKNIEQKEHALDFCGKVSLAGLTGLLAVSKLLISNDTGPLHLARALKTPTVATYWCGNVITSPPFSLSTNRTLLSWMIICPICGKNITGPDSGKNDTNCNHDVSFVDGISIDQVKIAAFDLLNQTGEWPQEAEQLPVLPSNYI
jgi:ADP-heptose:LPS heptosyltransferase